MSQTLIRRTFGYLLAIAGIALIVWGIVIVVKTIIGIVVPMALMLGIMTALVAIFVPKAPSVIGKVILQLTKSLWGILLSILRAAKLLPPAKKPKKK